MVNLTPGETVIVNLPHQNQDNITYDILRVSYKFNKVNNLGSNVVKVKLNKRILEFTDTIKNLILDVDELKGTDFFNSEILTRLEFSTGSYGLKIKEWKVRTRSIGDSFILGHPTNGKLGSPAPGASGGQVVLGSGTAGTFTVVRS